MNQPAPASMRAVPAALFMAASAGAWVAALLLRDVELARVMLWLGAFVVTPLALLASQPDRFIRLAFWAGPPAALLLAFATLPHGLHAAPWCLVTLGVALRGAWLGLTRKPGRDTLRAAGYGFLGVAGVWTWAEAAGYYFGFPQIIALLTGVHFQYAGLALQVLAWHAAVSRPGLIAGWGVTVGTPVVGITFLVSKMAEFVAASLLALAAIALALECARQALRMPWPARMLTWVSSLSLLVGMVLAVGYAAGMAFETYWLSIPTMVKTHGVLNGIGFCLIGLLGRLLNSKGGTFAA